MSGAATYAVYPRCCFHLSPTFNTWCLLFAAGIRSLNQPAGFEGQDIYFYKNLPIKWVRVVGVVVAIDDFPSRRVFTIDDSSGACLEATIAYSTAHNTETAAIAVDGSAAPLKSTTQAHGTNAQNSEGKSLHEKQGFPYSDLDTGAVVDIKGRVSAFRDEMQIKIEKMAQLRSTAQEIVLWEKRTKFRRDVLEQPWVLRDKDVRKCRKDAERSEEDVRRRADRVKAAVARSSKRHTGNNPGKVKKTTAAPAEQATSLESILRSSIKGQYSALGI